MGGRSWIWVVALGSACGVTGPSDSGTGLGTQGEPDTEIGSDSDTDSDTDLDTDPDTDLEFDTDPWIGDLIDSDGDGLWDHIEERYGYDPLVQDSDVDGIRDGWDLIGAEHVGASVLGVAADPMVVWFDPALAQMPTTYREERWIGAVFRRAQLDRGIELLVAADDVLRWVCSVNCGPQSGVNSTAEQRDRVEREAVDGALRLRWKDIEAWPGGISSPDYYVELHLDGIGVRLPTQAAGRAGWGPDPDFDGLSTADELRDGTDPLRMDTDGDGVPDFAEVQLGYDPLLEDTDGDGVLDGEELLIGGADDSVDGDQDGLSELQELVYGTDARLADTDGDWLTDGDEVAQGFDPTNRDTDGNGLPDVFETGEAPSLLDIPMGLTLVDVGDLARSAERVVEALLLYRTEYGVVGHVFDGNFAHPVYCFAVAQTWQCVEFQRGYFSRLFYLVNSASGGWVGTVEWQSSNRIVTSVVPLRPRDCQADDAPTSATDRDLDGLPNWRETSLGTDLLCPDTDGDGLYDGWEDLIGLSPLAYDTAGDEMPDLYAAFNHSHVSGLSIREDDDALDIRAEWQAGTHPLLADSDADGLLDHAEVALGTDPTLRMTQPGGRGDYIDTLAVGTMPVLSSEPLHLHVHTSEAVPQHRIWRSGTYVRDPWFGQVTGLHIVQQDGVVQAWLSGRRYVRALPMSCSVGGHILECVDSADPDGAHVTAVWSPDSTQVVVAHPRERSFYGFAPTSYIEGFIVRVLVDPCTPANPIPPEGEQCLDTDGDGLSDHFERLTRYYERDLVDSDSDGVDDYDEHLRGTNPGLADTDSDGVSDFNEHLAGTDPLDPNE